MFDTHSAESVEIVIQDGKVWVNVDGVCQFRAYRIKKISLKDERLTEQQIDAGAKALRDRHHNSMGITNDTPWEQCGEGYKEGFRRDARACLEAIFSGADASS
jgi:hypothetical protein